MLVDLSFSSLPLRPYRPPVSIPGSFRKNSVHLLREVLVTCDVANPFRHESAILQTIETEGICTKRLPRELIGKDKIMLLELTECCL